MANKQDLDTWISQAVRVASFHVQKNQFSPDQVRLAYDDALKHGASHQDIVGHIAPYCDSNFAKRGEQERARIKSA